MINIVILFVILFSQNGHSCLNLLAVGKDTLLLQRLLQYGASFSSRVVSHSSTQPLCASLTKDTHGTDTCVIHGYILYSSHKILLNCFNTAVTKLNIFDGYRPTEFGLSSVNLIGFYILGGSLLLAHNGICLLGDIGCLKKNTKETLQKGEH